MKFIPIRNIKEDMVLARPIFSPDGRVLLNTGVVLETHYIKRLQNLGVPGVYVIDENVGEIHFPENISQRTRSEATYAVKSAFDSLRIGKTFDFEPIADSVKKIIDEVVSHPNVVANLSDVRSFDGYTYAHSVNVCVLSILLGLKQELNETRLYELAIGAILHDIGKIMVPVEIIHKPGPLTEDEMSVMKKHTNYGWQILRRHPHIPLASAHIAYQHHERPHGLGYPRQLTSDKISPLAKIVGVADAYDAMTSERIYRRGILPHEALKVMRRLRGVQFESEVVDLLCESVVKYPVGCMVRLNSQELGIVVDVNHADHSRPIVRLLYKADGTKMRSFVELDLAKEPYHFIVEVVR